MDPRPGRPVDLPPAWVAAAKCLWVVLAVPGPLVLLRFPRALCVVFHRLLS